MDKNIFRRLPVLLLVLAMALGGAETFSGEIRALAFNYDGITGAAGVKGYLPVKYKQVITINAVDDNNADNTGATDATAAIQKSLTVASYNASDTVQVKVVLPAGVYSINKTLYVYSNTHLVMNGATLRKDYVRSGCMIRNAQPDRVGGFNDARNIIIEGGCIDGNGNSEMADFSNAKFGHMTNLLVKNVAFKGNLNAHHLELGGIRNVTVEGCDFSDYRGTKLKEAIQFDMMNSENLFGGFEPFDDTSCTNVIIRNNSFHEVMRGIGSHSATLGSYFTNFLIEDNTFTNIEDCTILTQSYKNLTIKNNTMDNVGSGIIMRNMSPFEDNTGYYAPVDDSIDILKRLNNNLNTLITGNTITAAVTEKRPSPVGIKLFGKLIQQGDLTKYDYKVEGVRIENNTLNIPGTCIAMDDVNGIKVKGNTLHFTGAAEDDHDLISVTNSSDTLFADNEALDPADDSFAVVNGRIDLQDMVLTNDTDGCCGVRSGKNGSVFGWDIDISTDGSASSPIYAERGSGNMVISGGSFSAAGYDSPAAISEAVIAVKVATLSGGNSEAVRVAENSMMYLYDCTLSTDVTDAPDGLDAAAVLCGSSDFGPVGKLSRLYLEDGSVNSNGDVIFTTNCKSEVILFGTELNTENNGYLVNCSSSPTRWGWGREGSGGSECRLTLMRQVLSGRLGCDSLSKLEIYLTDYSTYTGAPESYSAGELYGERGSISMNIEENSNWVITGDCTLDDLRCAGNIRDAEGNDAVIADSEGNILREGTSPYTVTVLDSYSLIPDPNAGNESYSFNDFKLGRIEIVTDQTYSEDDEEEEYEKGDINHSGALDISDLTMLAAHVKSIRAFPDPTYELRADLNRDGAIDVQDLMTMAAALKGIRPIP